VRREVGYVQLFPAAPVAAVVAGLHVPEDPVTSVVAVLGAILAAVLLLPMLSKRIEENLEPFFLAMGIVGVASLYASGLLTGEGLRELAVKALKTPLFIHGVPIGITQVVLVAGYIFYRYHSGITRSIRSLMARLGLPAFVFTIVLVLGLTSSIISVIVAAVIFAEVMASLPLPRGKKIELTVIAAFALGMGAALTPVGEPLATIAVSKLSGPPYHADPLFLLRHLGPYIVPGVVAISLLAAFRARGPAVAAAQETREEGEEYTETLRTVVMRAVRVFIFVAALELLGTSFTPLVEWYFVHIPPHILYWVNMISAVVDNATLTAAEIGPHMTLEQIKSALLSLVISGGMLIPGNIPNIVAAGRLKITSKEWARIGVPLGLALLAIYYVVLMLQGIH
jgi:predicted cation transporter